MKLFQFNAATPMQYHLSGTFRAPGPEWRHLTRQLFDFELFVVTDGTLFIAENDTEYALEKGEFLLMPPSVWQRGCRSSECAFYWLHFSPSSAYCIREDAASVSDGITMTVPARGILRSPERIAVLMKQLQDSQRRYGMACLNDFNSSIILAELCAQCAMLRGPAGSQLYNDIVDYITMNVCAPLRVADIADHFGYNQRYLTTYFRKWAHTSLKQFISQTKMEHARAELSETNLSIAQIGYHIGYGDPHNFSNAFKKSTGLTPSEYRDSYSKRQRNDQ